MEGGFAASRQPMRGRESCRYHAGSSWALQPPPSWRPGLLQRRAKKVKDKTGQAPKQYEDVHDVLADDSIDAVTIATPNHWQSLIAAWACQAGKDVYDEQPLSHNIWEGRQLVAAAEKYGRVVQHGT